MADFSLDIQNFQRYGTYVYKQDEVGNFIFNSSSVDFSQVYIAFPLLNVVYNNSKISSFYNINFEEFFPSSTISSSIKTIDILQEQLNIIQEENVTLKTQLDSIIIQSENSSSISDTLAIKQVILELRKALGQGRVESDFVQSFPYSPEEKTSTPII